MDDYGRVVGYLNECKTAADGTAKGLALAQVHELCVKKRPDLAARFLQPVLELTADPSPIVRQFVPTFVEATLQLNESLLSLPVAEAVLRLVSDKNSAVAKKAIGCCSFIYPRLMKLMVGAKFTDAQVLSKTLANVREAVLTLLSARPRPPVAMQVQCLKFVESLVLLAFGPSAQSYASTMMPLSALQEQGESFLAALVQYASTPGLEAPVQAAVLATLGAIACECGGQPARLEICLKPLLAFAESEEGAKATRKAAQLALLRVLRSGVALSPPQKADIEDAITLTGGAKQLEKLRKRDRSAPGGEPGGYTWDEDEPVAGGDVAVDPYLMMIQREQMQMSQQQQQQQMLQQQQQQQSLLDMDLVLLDSRVLVDVDALVRDLTPEQVAELVIETMANMGAVGAKPGDEAFFEMAAVARDPRLNEERKKIKAAPRQAILGTCDGLPVPRLDHAQLLAMWRGCVERIIGAEDAMLLKGSRATLLRCALLARLVCGSNGGPTQNETSRQVR